MAFYALNDSVCEWRMILGKHRKMLKYGSRIHCELSQTCAVLTSKARWVDMKHRLRRMSVTMQMAAHTSRAGHNPEADRPPRHIPDSESADTETWLMKPGILGHCKKWMMRVVSRSLGVLACRKICRIREDCSKSWPQSLTVSHTPGRRSRCARAHSSGWSSMVTGPDQA